MLKLIEYLQENQEILVALITFLTTTLPSLYSLYKEKKLNVETTILLLNTLKVENKMQGGKFSPELINKVGEIGEVIHAGQNSIDSVKEVLNSVNAVEIDESLAHAEAVEDNQKNKDVKIASYKGKAIYLTDVVKTGVTVSNLFKLFKK